VCVTCFTAQDVGPVALPFTLEGGLIPTIQTPMDIDFFRFTDTPGSIVRVDLEGQDTEQGTLEDPLLGAWDSACNLFAQNDASASSRLRIGVADLGACGEASEDKEVSHAQEVRCTALG
jgi:hypothetical protein